MCLMYTAVTEYSEYVGYIGLRINVDEAWTKVGDVNMA